ncbi:ATP-binding protein [Planotetraspora thailandica]|nr:ATP-binding protein [Planotetraspora thailandica]
MVDVLSAIGGITLDAELRSVSRVREYTREQIGHEHPAIDDVMLIASELTTNALVHSDSRSGGQITFAVVVLSDLVQVSVMDAGGPTVPRALSVDQDAEGGRGLQLVAALCENWGVCELPGDGRVVWAEIRTHK